MGLGSVCTKCGTEKPREEFHRKGDGLQKWCKQCHNQYQRETRKRRETPEARHKQNIKSRYGLTVEQLAAMKTAQGGACAICSASHKPLVIDHCHKTGKVRGLLCHRCNIFAAAIDDDAYREKAMTYLGVNQ